MFIPFTGLVSFMDRESITNFTNILINQRW